MPEAKRPRRLARLTEAAEQSPLSKASIRRLVAAGRLTAYRLPGMSKMVCVDLDEIDALFTGRGEHSA